VTHHKTTNLSDAIRNLIVCDTQFGWTGETTLKLPELLDLQARGWLIEGDENNEFSLTVEGEAIIARALRQARPAELAEQQGVCLPLLPEAFEAEFTAPGMSPVSVYTADQMRDYARAALAATGKQQVGEAVQDNRFPGGFADAITYVNELEELAEALHEKVFGHESDGESGASTVLQMTLHQLNEKPEQVGEVQGDAHVLVLREMRARLTDAGSPARTSALDAAIAALAARQPGAQAAVGEVYQGSARTPQARLSKPLPIGTLLYAAPPAQGMDLGPGVQAIAIERQRQMATERFTSTHDEQYQRGELAKAAVAYAQLAAMELDAGTRGHIGWLNPPAIWPWEAHWWKPVDARRDLVRAGALIAAQIDLIDQRDAAPGVGS
jgi:hypothetical protein